MGTVVFVCLILIIAIGLIIFIFNIIKHKKQSEQQIPREQFAISKNTHQSTTNDLVDKKNVSSLKTIIQNDRQDCSTKKVIQIDKKIPKEVSCHGDEELKQQIPEQECIEDEKCENKEISQYTQKLHELQTEQCNLLNQEEVIGRVENYELERDFVQISQSKSEQKVKNSVEYDLSTKQYWEAIDRELSKKYERRDCNGVVLYKVKGVYIYIYCYWCKSLLQDGDGCYIELPHDILDIKRVTDLLDYQVMTSIHIGIGNMPDRPQTHYSFQLNELSSRRISVEQMQKNINEDNANDNRHNMQSLTTHQVDKSSSQYQSSREWSKVSISKPIEVESNCSIVQTKESAPTVNKVSSHYETSKDWPVVEQTDSEHKGFAFEKFIDAHFPNKYFKRLEWRSDIKDGSGRLSESSKYPDLEYEIRKSGVRFAVECKWRHNFLKKDSDLIIWWAHDEKQINNYVQYGKRQNIDVVVIIGVGGTPDNPDKVYSIPLSKISSPYLTKDDLWNYFVGKQSSFFYNQTEHNIRLYHK